MSKYLFIFTLFFSITCGAQNHQWYRSLSIGSNALDASSILDVNSTSNGARPCPLMTEVQRDNIVSPVKGLCVFNSTSNLLNNFDGTIWVAAGGGGGGDLWSDPVDADIVPDAANSWDLGLITLPFEDGFIDDLFIMNGPSAGVGSFSLGNNNISANGFLIRTQAELPLTIQTVDDSSVDASPIPWLYILGGDKVGGGSTGNGGGVHIQTGTSVGGARGQLKIKDGTEGTIGHVFTSQTADGDGGWAVVGSTENINLDIIGGGDWSFNGTNLVLSADAYVQHPPFLDDRNTILAQSIALADGEVAYVDVNKVTDSTTNLTVSTAAVGTYVASTDRYVFARRDDFSDVIALQPLTNINGPFIDFTTPATWWGQSFLTNKSGTVDAVRFKLFRDVSLVGPFNIEIRTDSAGAPSGTILDTITVSAATVAAMSTSATGVLQTFIANSTANLASSTNYWAIFDPNFTAGGALQVEYATVSGYTPPYKRSLDSGSTWSTDFNVDLTFEILTIDENVQVGEKLTIMNGDSARIYSGIIPESSLSFVTADPCGNAVDFPESTQFYNDTSDKMCFCTGAGIDVEMDNATACF